MNCKCGILAREAVCTSDHISFPNRSYYFCDVCRYFKWNNPLVSVVSSPNYSLQQFRLLQLQDGELIKQQEQHRKGQYQCGCNRPVQVGTCRKDHDSFPERRYHYCDVCRYFKWEPLLLLTR